MNEDDLSRMVRNLNEVPLADERIARMLPLVTDVNARIRSAADQRLTIDNVPWSFLTFRGTAQGQTS